MLQYILTGLAGIALGIVGMRIWSQMQGPAPAEASVPEVAGQGGSAPAGSDGEGNAGEAGESTRAPRSLAEHMTTRNILIAAGLFCLAAIALIVLRPASDAPAPSGVAAARGMSGSTPNLDDVSTMIDRLARRLEENPDDGEGFRMLGWSYVMTGEPKKAIEPYKRALKLLPDDARVHTGYGEALVAIAGDKVTPGAKAAFEKAIAIDRSEPRARHFLALWKAQNGQEKAALDDWVALSNDGPANAPWQDDVRRKISEVSGKLGVDVSAQLKSPAPAAAVAGADAVAAPGEPPALDPATVEAARALPAAEQRAMIDGMVEGLAEKLKKNPADAEGWSRLLRSRMVLRQSEQAGKDLASARKALASDAAGLAQVNAVAREMDVPGAK